MSKEGNNDGSQLIEQLYQQERSKLLSVAQANGASPDDIEDIVHDVWVGFLTREDQIDMTINPQGYLSHSVRNRTIDYHRRNKRHSIVSLTPDDSDYSGSGGKAIKPVDLLEVIPDDQESVESQAIRRADNDLLRAKLDLVMATLPPVEQVILNLTADGFVGQEIAAQINKSDANVRNRKKRARDKAQPQLADYR